jgi:hypothetical protein
VLSSSFTSVVTGGKLKIFPVTLLGFRNPLMNEGWIGLALVPDREVVGLGPNILPPAAEEGP